MKKVMMFVLLAVVSSFSILPFTYKWTINLSGDTATVAKWRANNDSVLYWSGRICDTVNKAMFRKSWTRDSTFDSMKITRLKHTDSIYSRAARFSVIDSVFTPRGIKAATGTFSGKLSADSLFGRAIHGTKGYFDSLKNIVADSITTPLVKVTKCKADTSVGYGFMTKDTGTFVMGFSSTIFKTYQLDTFHYSINYVLMNGVKVKEVSLFVPQGIDSSYLTPGGGTFYSDSTLPVAIRLSSQQQAFPICIVDSSHNKTGTLVLRSTDSLIILAPYPNTAQWFFNGKFKKGFYSTLIKYWIHP
jgi:hypothetical protein